MSRKDMIFEHQKVETTIAIRVIPKAGMDRVSEFLSDGRIKIRLTAPPSGGKANDALKKFLSRILDIRESQISIIKGFTNRDKLLSIQGVDRKTIYERIIENTKSVHK
jgi:uncharacterized protein